MLGLLYSLTWGSFLPAGSSIPPGYAADNADTQPLECSAFDLTMPMDEDQWDDASLRGDEMDEEPAAPPKVG